MYIDRSRIGEEISVTLTNKREETRAITDIIANTDGEPVILWSSHSADGACIPDLWDKWKKGAIPYD